MNELIGAPFESELRAAYAQVQSKDYVDAFAKLQTMAAQGSDLAHFYLGQMHEKGFGTKVDMDRAIEHYKVAGKSGSKTACYYLARLLWRLSRFDEARHWFQTGADRGNVSSLYWLSTMYEEGTGIIPNTTLAEQYRLKAAEAGHLFAQRDLLFRALRGVYGWHRRLLAPYKIVRLLIKIARVASKDVLDERIN